MHPPSLRGPCNGPSCVRKVSCRAAITCAFHADSAACLNDQMLCEFVGFVLSDRNTNSKMSPHEDEMGMTASRTQQHRCSDCNRELRLFSPTAPYITRSIQIARTIRALTGRVFS
jgi:hypothetical protein